MRILIGSNRFWPALLIRFVGSHVYKKESILEYFDFSDNSIEKEYRKLDVGASSELSCFLRMSVLMCSVLGRGCFGIVTCDFKTFQNTIKYHF